MLFVIDLKTRRVHIADITPGADGGWMAQIARNLTDAAAGALPGFGHLIVDRDPLYTRQLESLLVSANVALLRLPVSSEKLNAFAERFVRSIKHECLRHVVPLGEHHLRKVVSERLLTCISTAHQADSGDAGTCESLFANLQGVGLCP